MNYAKKVQKALIEEQMSIGRQMSEGVCNTIEEYKRLVGMVQGIELAIIMIEDERVKQEESDYDED